MSHGRAAAVLLTPVCCLFVCLFVAEASGGFAAAAGTLSSAK
jgi:hypothetical protein